MGFFLPVALCATAREPLPRGLLVFPLETLRAVFLRGMMAPCIIGIDPGVSGGIAVFRNHLDVLTLRAPVIEWRDGKTIDAKKLFCIFNEIPDIAFFVLEAARSIKTHDGRSRMFNYGVGFGIYLGVIAAMGFPLYEVDAAKWKREMGVPADKKESMKIARQLMPGGAPRWEKLADDGQAEAALIAYYASRSILPLLRI